MPKSRQPTCTISFRISSSDERRLRELGAASGLSPGEMARELVRERLDESATLSRKLDRLGVDLDAFRMDFATAVEMVLRIVGSQQPVSRNEVEQWVAENLRPR